VTVKGIRVMVLALLIAEVIFLWCLAQFPEILRGIILPLSVIKYRSMEKSL
jgi:hypothetical protein